jgi:hypothetical protein
MRGFATISVTLLLFLGSGFTVAKARNDFVRAELIALTRVDDRWFLELKIVRWEAGVSWRKDAQQPRATLQFERMPACFANTAHAGSTDDFERALDLIRRQISAGGIHRFGLNAMQLTKAGDNYFAADLRVFQPGTDEEAVLAVAPDGDFSNCPLTPWGILQVLDVLNSIHGQGINRE